MPTIDFIPRTEEDFNDFQEQFGSILTARHVSWGIADSVSDDVNDAQTDWAAKYAAGKPEADPTRAQRQAKNDSRAAYTSLIRTVVKQHIRNNPLVTNDDLVTLGLKVPDTVRTRAAVPGYAPVMQLDGIAHLRHKIRITDPTNPNTKKKPAGVARINVYRFIGTAAPSGFGDYQLVASATKFLFTSSFSDADVGKKAWYIVQYENTRGERGPVSDAVSGTIA